MFANANVARPDQRTMKRQNGPVPNTPTRTGSHTSKISCSPCPAALLPSHVQSTANAFTKTASQLDTIRVAPESTTRADPNITITEDDRQNKAWKYMGYPRFSEWMDLSDDFFMLRRFGPLNARVLLYMQDHIVRKEQELQSIDEEVMNLPDTDFTCNNSFRAECLSEKGRRREVIMQELIPMLKQYSMIAASLSMSTLN